MTKIFTEEENQAWSKRLPGKMSSACLALISPKNRVLMVKATYKEHWTFPSGIVDELESPKETAIRETFEEIGLRLSKSSCTLLTVVYTASDGSSRDRFNFAFTAKTSSESIDFFTPNSEIESVKWVDLNDIASLSGNRGSYRVFQKYLSDLDSALPYTEVSPA